MQIDIDRPGEAHAAPSCALACVPSRSTAPQWNMRLEGASPLTAVCLAHGLEERRLNIQMSLCSTPSLVYPRVPGCSSLPSAVGSE